MKARTFVGVPQIHPYQVGDLLLEIDRSATQGPVMLKTMGENLPADLLQQQADEFLNRLKVDTKDFGSLKQALQFLKFNPEDLQAYQEAIENTIKMAASCATIIGTIVTVAQFVMKLFDNKETTTVQYLKVILDRVNAIYAFLAGEQKRGLHNEAVAWRGHVQNVRNAINNAQGSRSPLNLQNLTEVIKVQMDNDLTMMLDWNRKIAFVRSTYGYEGSGAHWIDCAISPFMKWADGSPINYRDPSTELAGEIWDPGHYIDMLLGTITDRLKLLAVTEPAFRSTCYDRDQIQAILDGLTLFLNKWRASIIIADPLVGLNGGGHLQHPNWHAPIGIPIGAVDPVTGVSFFEAFWQDWVREDVWEASMAAKGSPDYSRAKDPADALAKALYLQPRLLDATIRASGIPQFAEFRRRLQDILDRATIGSDYVELPNATFHLVQMNGPAAAIETVDLGFVGNYSKHPGKQYQGQRYTQVLEKKFRFAMPLRTDVSRIQLGYRMEVGNRSITMIPYSVSPADGSLGPRFPTTPISVDIRENDWRIYDVYQSNIFSTIDEDKFEGIEPPPTPLFIRRITAFSGERLYLNERRGPAALHVDITFEADLNNPDQPFVGHANVTIRNLDPQTCPGGLIVPITVYETRRTGQGSQTEEVIADRMTVHIVPSFLVVGRDYFTDRREGLEAMDNIFGGINEKYAKSVQPKVPIGPEWQIRRRAVEDAAKHDAIERFRRAEPRAANALIRRVMPPTPVPMHER